MQQNNVCVNGGEHKVGEESARSSELDWECAEEEAVFVETSFKTLELNSNELLHSKFSHRKQKLCQIRCRRAQLPTLSTTNRDHPTKLIFSSKSLI